ncbi:hypothetical protein SAMN05519226_1853 [Cycloclasticus pugetii]|nr:hypothetical protein SAMN05519226_1853 [Cycloclasticus pugetii]
MEFLIIAYFIIGLVHANSRVNNPNPALRTIWASDKSCSFSLRLGGFLLIAFFWPITMILG